MIWFVIGLVVGAVISVPVIPLLRAADPVFGRAAAGVVAVAVLLFAVRLYLELADHDDVPFEGVVAAAFNSLLAVKSIFGFAAVVAMVGVFVWRRA
jgi:hypothetical protein